MNFRLTEAMTLLAVSALSTGSVFSADRTFIKLHQEVPELHYVDQLPEGHSYGDVLAFEAVLTGENGVKAMIDGFHMTVHLADGTRNVEDRVGEMIIDFGGGTSLLMAGKLVYAPTSTEMASNVPQIRTVVGGTGTYIGARGQMTTVRNVDGTYDHIIELLN